MNDLGLWTSAFADLPPRPESLSKCRLVDGVGGDYWLAMQMARLHRSKFTNDSACYSGFCMQCGKKSRRPALAYEKAGRLDLVVQYGQYGFAAGDGERVQQLPCRSLVQLQ